jgi:asparagine synthase (glutamine-hydrolysing)
MCGVVSIVSQDEPVSETALLRAVVSLSHRGPDGRGMWVAPGQHVGLGHARLAVIDLDTGSQPIASEDGQVRIVVNGEFYGHRDIRRQLERRGHRFSTHCDSEIALHLYEEHGEDCLKELRGEFAFILWDGRRELLLAARDRFGVKPLCYAVHGQTMLIASEAKAIFAAGLPAAWDAAAFFHAACLQYVPPDRTLFQGVAQVPPGHYLTVRGGRTRIVRYWDMDYPPAVPGAAEAGEAGPRLELAARLEEAVRLRLDADVPVCFHLSGGLDSSAIVGLASRLAAGPLDCFTVGFEHEAYDELPAARDMALHAGARLHEVRLTQDDLLEALPDAVYFAEGLAINGHLPAKYLLGKAIHRAGFKVVLSGEGSDEVMAGYAHLRQDHFRDRPSGEGAADSIARLHADNTMMAGIQLPEGPTLPLEAVERALGFVPTFLRAKGTYGYRMRGVLADDFVADFDRSDCFRAMLDGFDVKGQLAGRHRVDQATYLWSKLALANYILRTLGDGTEMAHGVEGRLPFLDHPLFEFARCLPIGLKIRGTVEKYLLREAMRPVVTEAVYRRPKQPFTAPPLRGLGSGATFDKLSAGAGRLLRDVVSSQSFAALPFFDRAKVLRLLDAVPNLTPRERVAMDPVLITILSAALLHSRYRL